MKNRNKRWVIFLCLVLLALSSCADKKEYLENELDLALDRLSVSLVEPVWGFNSEMIKTVIAEELANKDIIGIIVYDIDGTSVWEYAVSPEYMNISGYKRYDDSENKWGNFVADLVYSDMIFSKVKRDSWGSGKRQIVYDSEVIGSVEVFVTDKYFNALQNLFE